ncbi:hypothetical protein HZF08_01055 [Paenibacillus sp. CGMCC 1.16610]|uniref:Lipoprotein n=1 Tax=Paenibacillus anseongense TaxID=2682845 RepID=A0ABW9U209_9BACL|nr:MULTISPECIES: hypothetical protein [Paenibacillus]MBA2936888.1 hypothetical protein [Paenibacillus sp. CGMCC 1.16610]MVQ33215.1 hypothetical protein [Paenibacillus anseongense]
MQKVQINIYLLGLTTLAFTACTSHYPTHTKTSNSTTTTSEASDTTPIVLTPIMTSTPPPPISTSKAITPEPELTPAPAPNQTQSGGVSSSTASKDYTLPEYYAYSGGSLPEDIVNPIEYRVQVKINDMMPEFSFEAFGQTVQSYQLRDDKKMYYLKDGVNKVNKIVVQCKPLSYQQELLFDETETPNISEVTYGFNLSDWNFDGYSDISLWKNVGGTSLNEPRYYWLWDNEKHRYVENNDLEDISETAYLEIKAGDQQLTANSRKTNGYYHEDYVWQDGKIVLARTEDATFEGPTESTGKRGVHIIVKERIDGVMKVTKDYHKD